MDESRFSLERDSRRYLIWENIRERDVYERGRACVCGNISLGGRTDLHIIPRRIVNTEVYRDGIVEAYQRLMLSCYRTTTQDHTGLS